MAKTSGGVAHTSKVLQHTVNGKQKSKQCEPVGGTPAWKLGKVAGMSQ